MHNTIKSIIDLNYTCNNFSSVVCLSNAVICVECQKGILLQCYWHGGKGTVY